MFKVQSFSEVEQVIEKSRFICRIYPVNSEKQIEEIIHEVRKEHRKSTHVVSAYRIGLSQVRGIYNDDGEPSLSAGAPMLHILETEDVTDVLALTIRYFGGIKLGVGGLIRAYSSVTKEALQKVNKKTLREVCKYSVSYDYTYHGLMEGLLQDEYKEVPQFDQAVTQFIFLTSEEVISNLLEITNGTAKVNRMSCGVLELPFSGTIITGGYHERIN